MALPLIYLAAANGFEAKVAIMDKGYDTGPRQLKHEWALLPLRVRGLDRVRMQRRLDDLGETQHRDTIRRVSAYGDEEKERHEFVRALIQRLAPRPASLVELGAAPGDQAVALARLGYTVSAVDLGEASDEWGQQVQGTMKAAFVEAGIDLLIWDLEKIPYPIADSSFDVVLLTEVFEHLREYPARTLAEGYRILRPGGLLVLSTPNAASIENRVKLLCGKSVYSSLNDWLHGIPHARHAREYTKSELELVVHHVGFELVSIEGRHFYRRHGNRSLPALLGKALINATAKRWPTLGPAFVVAAHRPA